MYFFSDHMFKKREKNQVHYCSRFVSDGIYFLHGRQFGYFRLMTKSVLIAYQSFSYFWTVPAQGWGLTLLPKTGLEVGKKLGRKAAGPVDPNWPNIYFTAHNILPSNKLKGVTGQLCGVLPVSSGQLSQLRFRQNLIFTNTHIYRPFINRCEAHLCWHKVLSTSMVCNTHVWPELSALFSEEFTVL